MCDINCESPARHMKIKSVKGAETGKSWVSLKAREGNKAQRCSGRRLVCIPRIFFFWGGGSLREGLLPCYENVGSALRES